MKLLIITQKVNKDNPEFSFFYRWIEEFSKRCSLVTVICLEEGNHTFADNVRVLSLGKESGSSRLKYASRFYHYIWKERKNYDVVFVHMNPEYIVLGGLLWKIWGKKIALWYTHRQVNLKLRIATMFADIIFTASAEGFGIKTNKLRVMGHGIDVDAFNLPPVDFTQPLVIGHVGRITEIKHLDTILRAVKNLSVEHVDFTGAPVTKEDMEYKKYLESLVKELHLDAKVRWSGVRPSIEAYTEASLTINAAPDGGMDKVVLESLAAGRPVFVSNKAFEKVFGEYADMFMYPHGDDAVLAEKIKKSLSNPLLSKAVISFQEKIKREYSVEGVIVKIVNSFQELFIPVSLSKKIRKSFSSSANTAKAFIKTYIFVDKLFVIRQAFKENDMKSNLRCGYPLNENSIVFDLGGYKGEWAQRMWDLYHCTIYIFEPVKEFFEEASERFTGNQKVHLFNFGLSERDSEETISVNGVASSVFVGERNTIIQLKDVKGVIDSLNVQHIDLLKINIEGGEFKVLPRMIESGLIPLCNDIQIEFHIFYPNAEKLRKGIQNELAKTHHLTYDYPFFFENWRQN